MDGMYVSAFQIFNNVYDIKIDFSAIEPVIDENGEIVKDDRVTKARITMTPVLAKELANILAGVVGDYEQRHGKIPEIK